MESPKEYSEAEVLHTLKNSEGIEVVAEKKEMFPIDFNPAGFDAELATKTPHIQKELEEAAKMCRAFLSGSVITDTFTDHSVRREWRHRMFNNYGRSFSKVYDTNKLRINNLGGVYSWLQTVSQGLRIFKVKSPKADEIRALTPTLPSLEKYDELSVDEKVALVGHVDEICLKFLEIIARAE